MSTTGQITAVAEWPQIITPEQSDRLRAIPEVNRRRRRRVSRSYLLTGGLARCASCGRPSCPDPSRTADGLHLRSGTGGCGGPILADPFEAWVTERASPPSTATAPRRAASPRHDDGAVACSAACRRGAHRDAGRRLRRWSAAGERLPSALDVLEADRRAALTELDGRSRPRPAGGSHRAAGGGVGGPGGPPAPGRARPPARRGDGRPGGAWAQPLRPVPAVDHVAGVTAGLAPVNVVR